MFLLVGLISALAFGTALMMPDVTTNDTSDTDADASEPDVTTDQIKNDIDLLNDPNDPPSSTAEAGASPPPLVSASLGMPTVITDGAQDTVIGTSNSEIMSGGAADDELGGYEGNDTLFGGEGRDNMLGMSGNDFTFGGDGIDTLQGGLGLDAVFGGAGNDDLTGQSGDDNIFGDAGNDELIGGAGQDTLHGGSGDDALQGADGHDVLILGDGSDTAFGGAGNDSITGGDDGQIDFLNGGAGDDTLNLSGGDVGHGGAGGDVFVVVGSGEPAPEIVDFNQSEDMIIVQSSLTNDSLSFVTTGPNLSNGELWLGDAIVAKLEGTPSLDFSRVMVVPPPS